MSQPLTIRFATDIDSAKRGMANLAASVASNAVSMASTLKAVNDNADKVASTLSALPNAARGAAVMVGAYLALKAAIDLTTAAANAAQQQLDGLMKIARSAESAGVGTTFFQGLTLQAKELGTETSKLEGMLTRARDASTLKIGEGDKAASSQIQDRLKQNVLAGNLDQNDLDRFTGAKDQEGRIRVILDLIEQLRSKGMQLAAFDLGAKMFGPDFEAKLRNGVDIIGSMRAALEGLTTAGGERVKSEQEIASAQRISEAIMRAQKTMADALAPIQRDIAGWEQDQAAALASMKENLASIVASAASLYGYVKGVGDAITAAGNSPFWAKLSEWLPRINEGAVVDISPEEREKLARPAEPPPMAITVRGDKSKSLPSLNPPNPAAESEKEDPVDTYIKGLERATAALKAETEAYGKSNAEKLVAVDLAKAMEIAKQNDRSLSDDEVRRIRATAQAAGEAKDRMAEMQAASQRAADAVRSFGDMGVSALSDLILEGRSFNDVLNSMVKQLAKMALQAALTGSGPLAGLFGTAPAAGATGASSVGGLFGSLLGGKSGSLDATLGGGAVKAAGGGGSLVSSATSMLGMTETGDRTQLNSFLKGNGVDLDVARDAWCAGFVNANLKSLGIGGSGSNVATSFLNFGSKVPDLSKVLPGDILVEARGRSAGQAGGHVGIATGQTRQTDEGGLQLEMISGNYSNAVKRSWEGADSLVGRRALTDVAGDASKQVSDLSDSVGKLATSADGTAGPLDAITKGLGSLGTDIAKGATGGASSGGGFGGLIGLLGKAFGIGANAEGTDDWRGGLSMVGERGPELVNLPRGSQVIPNNLLRGVRAGGGSTSVGGMTLVQHIHGGGDEAIASIARQASAQAVAGHQRFLERNLPGMVAGAQRRGF